MYRFAFSFFVIAGVSLLWIYFYGIVSTLYILHHLRQPNEKSEKTDDDGKRASIVGNLMDEIEWNINA